MEPNEFLETRGEIKVDKTAVIEALPSEDKAFLNYQVKQAQLELEHLHARYGVETVSDCIAKVQAKQMPREAMRTLRERLSKAHAFVDSVKPLRSFEELELSFTLDHRLVSPDFDTPLGQAVPLDQRTVDILDVVTLPDGGFASLDNTGVLYLWSSEGKFRYCKKIGEILITNPKLTVTLEGDVVVPTQIEENETILSRGMIFSPDSQELIGTICTGSYGLHPDGYLVGYRYGKDRSMAVAKFDMKTGEEIDIVSTDERTFVVNNVLPSGNLLVSYSQHVGENKYEYNYGVFDIATKNIVQNIRKADAYQEQYITSNDEFILSTNNDHRLKVIGMNEGKITHAIQDYYRVLSVDAFPHNEVWLRTGGNFFIVTSSGFNEVYFSVSKFEFAQDLKFSHVGGVLANVGDGRIVLFT